MFFKNSILFAIVASWSITAEVYDCFLFCHELEILDIHLHELDSQVDKFVIVESQETFRGKKKPLFFEENAHHFENFLHKIIHIVVEPVDVPKAWDREFYQRNAIARGLINCRDDDIIIIADVDEIIRGSDIPVLKRALLNNECRFVGTNLDYHSNFLNSESGGYCQGPVATKFENFKVMNPQGVREVRERIPRLVGGWHFTWQGDISKILYKIQSFSHEEMDTPEIHEEKKIGYEYRHTGKFVEVDETFPKYVRDNLTYFISKGYIMTGEEINRLKAFHSKKTNE